MNETKEQLKISDNIDSNKLDQLTKRNSVRSLEQHPAKKVITTISELLNNMCKENSSLEINDKNIASNKKIKYFMLKKIPSISIKDFLFRLTKYSKICESTLIMILIYIDRMCHKYNFKITYYNIYKLILAAMVVAIKYNEDEFYTLDFYGKLGGISKYEMNILEYEFAFMINFKLYITEELFYKYYELLINTSNEKE
jgi:hypothetical protein